MKKALVFLLAVLLVTAVIVAGVFVFLHVQDKASYEAELAAYGTAFEDEILAASRAYEVPPDLILSVIRTESGFEPQAKSGAGAVGLMQLMPESYEWFCFRQGIEYDVTRLTDPAVNIDAGVWMLAYLYERYENWDTALAAYNAGFGRVDQWLKDPAITQNGNLVNIPIDETAAYVRVVNSTKAHYDALYTFGTDITVIPYETYQERKGN